MRLRMDCFQFARRIANADHEWLVPPETKKASSLVLPDKKAL